MNSIIFLVIWLHLSDPSGTPSAGAQFITSYKSMRECTAVKERIEAKDSALKGRVSCLQIIAALPDASESL